MESCYVDLGFMCWQTPIRFLIFIILFTAIWVLAGIVWWKHIRQIEMHLQRFLRRIVTHLRVVNKMRQLDDQAVRIGLGRLSEEDMQARYRNNRHWLRLLHLRYKVKYGTKNETTNQ